MEDAERALRGEIIRACRNFFDEQGFVLVDAPIFTPNACEGTTTLFQTDYFDEKAYLAQSGQLYSEATAAAFGCSSRVGETVTPFSNSLAENRTSRPDSKSMLWN